MCGGCFTSSSSFITLFLYMFYIYTKSTNKKKNWEEKPHKHFLVSLSYYIATSSFSPLSEYPLNMCIDITYSQHRNTIFFLVVQSYNIYLFRIIHIAFTITTHSKTRWEYFSWSQKKKKNIYKKY